MKAAQAANAQATGARNLTDKLGAAAAAGSILTGTIASMTDETDGWINEAADAAFQISILITAVDTLSRSFGALKIASMGVIGGAVAVAAGAGYALYDQVQNYNKNASHVTGYRINEHGQPEYTYDYAPSQLIIRRRKMPNAAGKPEPIRLMSNENLLMT